MIISLGSKVVTLGGSEREKREERDLRHKISYIKEREERESWKLGGKLFINQAI